MAWLVTHMWMVLTAAAVFALMLGWTVRGILLTGKVRKSIVDKDIALTELEQAREEIESLFAAQRAQRGEGGSVADASARKISDLTTELQKAKAELNSLKSSSAAKAPASASAGTPASDRTEMPTIVLPPARSPAEEAESVAAGSDGGAGNEEEAPSLIWRNRHLEARVQHLEAQLAEASAAPAPVVEAEPVAEAAPVMAAIPSVDEEGLSKLKWQADYLKQRVESLEAELAKVPTEAPPAAADDSNEEMARLRWRNRFLEGRLAYFEGGTEEADAVEVSDAEAFVEQADEPLDDDMLIGAEATLDELEDPHVVVEDEEAAHDEIVEAVEEAPEEVRDPVEATLVQDEETGDEDEAEAVAFADVSNDEEESLDEADHADEDVLSDEEYDEDNFVEEDEVEDDADEADDLEGDDETDDVEIEDEDDEADDLEDDASDEDESDEDDVYEDDEEEDDADDDEEAFDEEDEFDTDEDEDASDEGDETDLDESEDDAEDEDEDDLEESEDDEDGEYDEDDEESDEDDDSEEDSDDEEDDESDALEDDAEEDELDEDEDAFEDDASGDEYEDDDEDAEGDADVSYEPTGDVIVAERPMSMPGPVEGHPDDLTLIGGIGPKIQILLNELGIWHYDQIAAWSPENVAWVDEHLNFNGRIVREGWVEQAAVLVADAESV